VGKKGAATDVKKKSIDRTNERKRRKGPCRSPRGGRGSAHQTKKNRNEKEKGVFPSLYFGKEPCSRREAPLSPNMDLLAQKKRTGGAASHGKKGAARSIKRGEAFRGHAERGRGRCRS